MISLALSPMPQTIINGFQCSPRWVLVTPDDRSKQERGNSIYPHDFSMEWSTIKNRLLIKTLKMMKRTVIGNGALMKRGLLFYADLPYSTTIINSKVFPLSRGLSIRKWEKHTP